MVEDRRVLGTLGISAFSEDLYALLLERPGLSISESARRLDSTTARARDALHELESKGLATRSASRQPQFFPTSPELALGILLHQQEDELSRARAAITGYQETFVKASAVSPLHLVEVVLGHEAVLQRISQLQSVATQEILVFDKPPYEATEQQVTATEIDHLERGVRARVIYERSALEAPGQLATLRQLADLGEEARLLDRLPTKLMIADRRHAIVPLADDAPGVDGIVLLNATPMLNALIALFESLWRTATPIGLRTDPGPADRDVLPAADKALLTLLSAGLKDDAMAHQLGVSRRTVQRRIRQLMVRLGVQSRTQIVLQAVRQGLLS
ncbi:MAG: helix-turn-helix transcriptional regulator [Nocardioidaceae bacterium]